MSILKVLIEPSKTIVTIRNQCKELNEDLFCLFEMTSLKTEKEGYNQREIKITYNNGVYFLYVERHLYFQHHDAEVLLGKVYYVIMLYAKCNNHSLILHGAAIVYEGNAFLFLGRSEMGKSTTILLLEEDYEYLSDEILFIRPDRLSVIAFPISPAFRMNVAETQNEKNTSKQTYIKIDKKERYERKRIIKKRNSTINGKEYPVNKIIFLERGEFSSIEISAIDKYALIQRLCGSLLTTDQAGVKGIIDVCKYVEAYTICYSNGNKYIEALKSIIEE